tara:strand:- start:487 stop:687 length:201 start_codon:yes stop_codon:yes gene_type:complete
MKTKIKNILLEIITTNGIEWKDIVVEIQRRIIINNWNVVRSVIQELKNENIIIRDDNIMKEIYISK